MRVVRPAAVPVIRFVGVQVVVAASEPVIMKVLVLAGDRAVAV